MPKDDETQILERLAEFTGQVVVIVEKMKDVVEQFAADRYDELEKAAGGVRIAGKPVVELILDRVIDDFGGFGGGETILGLTLEFRFANEY